MAFDMAKARVDIARASLKMREEARQCLDAALAKGDRKEARSWASMLRKLNKLIAEYGIERYA
jgi:hypothetical protein